MSSSNEHGPPGRRFRSRDEQLRERVVQQYAGKWELDNIAEESLAQFSRNANFALTREANTVSSCPARLASTSRYALPGRCGEWQTAIASA